MTADSSLRNPKETGCTIRSELISNGAFILVKSYACHKLKSIQITKVLTLFST